MEKKKESSTKLAQTERLKIILAAFEEKSYWTQSELKEKLKIKNPTGAVAKRLERDLGFLVEFGLIKRHDYATCPICGTLLRRPYYSLPKEKPARATVAIECGDRRS